MQIANALGISVNLLAENKKVIPIYFLNGDTWHTNIKLPDIVLVNHSSDHTFSIREISLVGLAGGKKVVTFYLDEAELRKVIADTSRLLTKLLVQPVTPWRVYNLHMIFGDIPLAETGFISQNQVKPGSRVCLRLQELCNFHFVGREKINELICLFKLTEEGTEIMIEAPIDLTPYECKGQYTFPIRGCSTINGTPWNRVLGHRIAHSQEFAFDVVDFQRDEMGQFTLSSPPDSDNVKDYYLFERDVHAVGDGIVVAVGKEWPNAWVENPLAYSENRIVELTEKLLAEGLDFNHAILGNYAVIDHQNGEFSLYAHMSEGTLTVDVGDLVVQGQVIGKVGNTSNSDFPHLHFHLMDSADFQTANGLPIIFSDLPGGKAPICDFENANSYLFSDYLFTYLPDEQ